MRSLAALGWRAASWTRTRLGLSVGLAFWLVFVLPTNAFAQVSTKPITVVVPFAAGGPTDIIARLFAQHARESLGQTVVVENVAGANGTVGVGKVARATPDGSTLVLGHWSTHVVNGAIYQLPYDLQTDFEPIGLISSNAYLIVAKNTVPATDLKASSLG